VLIKLQRTPLFLTSKPSTEGGAVGMKRSKNTAQVEDKFFVGVQDVREEY
jgi:hypothetical protein